MQRAVFDGDCISLHRRADLTPFRRNQTVCLVLAHRPPGKNTKMMARGRLQEACIKHPEKLSSMATSSLHRRASLGHSTREKSDDSPRPGTSSGGQLTKLQRLKHSTWPGYVCHEPGSQAPTSTFSRRYSTLPSRSVCSQPPLRERGCKQ